MRGTIVGKDLRDKAKRKTTNDVTTTRKTGRNNDIGCASLNMKAETQKEANVSYAIGLHMPAKISYWSGKR